MKQKTEGVTATGSKVREDTQPASKKRIKKRKKPDANIPIL